MMEIFTIGIIAFLLALLWANIAKHIQAFARFIKNIFIGKTDMIVFENSYIDGKYFYMREFNIMPCITTIGNLDLSKVFDYINTGLAGKVRATYQRNFYNWAEEKQFFHKTVFKIEDRVMIVLSGDFVEIYHDKSKYSYAENLVKAFAGFKAPEKEKEYEINIITVNDGSLDLKTLDIKPTKLDVGLYYNDDFLEIHAIIRERLSRDIDKGIILLHGLPGTGKTTYLRHLIGSIEKKVLFVSPAVAANLMNPEFMDLLIDNPNAVLVIEDAENIIMDRKFANSSSVSNLLNISDGLLSDCLNVQIICTFNNALSMVDDALMRKGRLIAKYEFGKLGIEKAQKLSDHLGLKQSITKPMTLAEISNPDDKEYMPDRIEVLGFRRNEVLMN